MMISILGLVIGFSGILLGNMLEGGQIGSLLQGTAALIVFGGTLGAVMLSHRKEDLLLALGYLKTLGGADDVDAREVIARETIQAAQLARRDSILALESSLAKFSDPFMRTVYRFVIDGADPEVLRRIFEEEISINEKRKLAAAKVWADAGGFAPTIGIIGAVLGLISVMSNISDTSALGHGIAVAFVATIYGVASANLVFLPLSNKLKSMIRFRSETEQMIVEGACSIVGGMNPYLIEQKMRAFTHKVKVS